MPALRSTVNEPESFAPHTLRELRDLLQLLVRQMTHRSFATPRQMQMGVGNAVTLVTRAGDFPHRALLIRCLPDLLRELSNRRPDKHRYVLMLEESIRGIDQLLADSGME